MGVATIVAGTAMTVEGGADVLSGSKVLANIDNGAGASSTPKKSKPKWDTPENWAKHDANIVKKKHLDAVRGNTGARSGEHGGSFNKAARELDDMIKASEKRGDLKGYTDTLRAKAKKFRQRAKEINHKM